MHHAIKGGKSTSYRHSRNVVRRIRYRWYLRGRQQEKQENKEEVVDGATSWGFNRPAGFEDRMPALAPLSSAPLLVASTESKMDITDATDNKKTPLPPLPLLSPEAMPSSLRAFFDSPVLDSDFDYSEAQMNNELHRVAQKQKQKRGDGQDQDRDGGSSDVYARCAQVLLKLFSMSVSKTLLWDVDRSEFEEYVLRINFFSRSRLELWLFLYTILLLSFSSGALGSPDLLFTIILCNNIIIAQYHHTFILIIFNDTDTDTI